MSRRKLYVAQLDDPYLRQNFKTVGEIFNGNPFLKGEWLFLELQILATGANVKLPHTLAFTPKDAIILSCVGGTATLNYANFDSTYFYVNATLSSSTPMVIRLFIGRYTEDSVNV